MGTEAAHEPATVHCPHADRCPGCPLIAIPYREQLAQKQRQVLAAFARHPETATLEVGATVGANAVEGYRRRAKLIVAPGPEIGLYASHTDHTVVDIPHCRVLSTTIANFVARLRGLLADAPSDAGAALVAYDPAAPVAPGAHATSGARRAVTGGALLAIDVRETTEPVSPSPGAQGGGRAAGSGAEVERAKARLLVTLVLARDTAISREQIAAAARAVAEVEPAVVGVAVSRRAADAPQVLGAETSVRWGEPSSRDALGASGVYQLATFGSFAQAHAGQAAHIAELVATEVGLATSTPSVLELYAGSGAIGLPLAARGAAVTLVEAFPPAAQAAHLAARDQRISAEVVASDALVALRDFADAGRHFDVVVVDPPRRGLPPEVRRAIADLAPRSIVYVSCEPDSLARDLAHFARLGQRATLATPLDMMPQTDQVETVVVLHPTAPRPVVELYASEHVIALEKPAFTPADAVLATVGATTFAPGLTLADDESGILLGTLSSSPSGPQVVAVEICLLAKGIMHAAGRLHLAKRHRDGKRAAGAEARYRRTEVVGGHSLLDVLIQGSGGSTARVRRALSALGHPIVGDDKLGHPATNRHFFERHLLDRAFVHVKKLTLSNPPAGNPRVLASPLPGDLASVLSRLGKATPGPRTPTLG